MPGCDAVPTHVGGQELVGPQLVGITQFLRLLTSTILHPGDRVVRQLARLPRPGQLSQRCVKPELEALSDAKHHRATADAMVARDRLVTLARQSSQQDRSPLST